jgi:hypothetical protein
MKLWTIERRLNFLGVFVTHRPSGLQFAADTRAQAEQLIADGRYAAEIASAYAVKPLSEDTVPLILADPDAVLRRAFNATDEF